MEQEIIDLAKYRLKRAKECLKEGEILFKKGLIKGAINRFYYAVFHSARSLLALKKTDSKTHSGVITLFSKHFVKEGLFFPEKAKILSRSLERRIDSDYEDYAEISLQDGERMKGEVKVFVKDCSELLNKFLSKEKEEENLKFGSFGANLGL
ncbi:MAG: HEPN domain-containing protein [bacterium]